MITDAKILQADQEGGFRDRPIDMAMLLCADRLCRMDRLESYCPGRACPVIGPWQLLQQECGREKIYREIALGI